MTDLDKVREEYKHALRSTYVSRDADECGRTYGLVDEDKADTLIAALEAEVERLRRPFKLYDSSEMTNRIARLTARVQVTEAKLIDTAELYERMKLRAEAAEAKVLQLGIEKDAEEYRANVAEAERDRLAWMLERIRDSEYDRMSDADALADLAARYDARHEDGDG